MRRIGWIILLMLLIHSPALKAQEDGQWGSSLAIELSKKVFKGVNLSFEEEFRTRENFSVVDRYSHTLELSYKPLKFLKVGGAYNLINYNHPTKDWEVRHRYYLYATGSYSFAGFTVSLRERFQSTYRSGVTETSKRANPKYYLRSRLGVEYNIPHCHLTPYTSLELFNSLNDPQGNSMDQYRIIGGLGYDFNKSNKLEVFYRYSNKLDDDISSSHLVGVGYSFKF